MTFFGIKMHLDKHHYLIFKYKSIVYSLQKKFSLFHSTYRLITTDCLCGQYKSLEDLFCNVYMGDGTLLMEAIDNIELHKWDDPMWEEYEVVRHCAIIYRNEIHFFYNEVSYWISHNNRQIACLSDDFGCSQSFATCYELFENARINGATLKAIWNEVIVDAC